MTARGVIIVIFAWDQGTDDRWKKYTGSVFHGAFTRNRCFGIGQTDVTHGEIHLLDAQ